MRLISQRSLDQLSKRQMLEFVEQRELRVPDRFRPLVQLFANQSLALPFKDNEVGNSFWKGVGWNMVVFLAALQQVPMDLYEAAEMDGVSQLGNLIYIVLPMSKAVLSAICMFTMVGHWNSWFDVSIYISDNALWTLQYYIKVNFDNTSGLNQGQLDFIISQGSSVNSITMKMALTVISVLPMLVLYPFFQKYFTQGRKYLRPPRD